jgi:hypothetical protein
VRPSYPQTRLVPAAVFFFILYSLGFPAFLTWVLFKPEHASKIFMDQLLRAQNLGDTKDTNPHCYYFRCASSGGRGRWGWGRGRGGLLDSCRGVGT